MTSKRARSVAWELDPGKLRSAMLRRVERSTELQLQLAFAAVPALLDHYLSKCDALFDVASRPLQPKQRAEFRRLLLQALRTGFALSAHSKVVVQITSDPPPQTTVSYQIGVQTKDIADVYATWLQASSPPYFGAHPDAKVMAVARDLAASGARAKVLDVGAGTGRNALPLAKLGLEVDAAEFTPAFAASLRAAAAEAKLSVNVFEGDAFDPALGLPAASYALIVASEVASSHLRGLADLREFFGFASQKLARGGLLLCNVFLARSGYAPDELSREVSPAVLSTLFSPADLEQCLSGLPFALLSNEGCLDYEREHLPAEAWPPTRWFEAWANGNNLFDIQGRAPCELRWLVYQRS